MTATKQQPKTSSTHVRKGYADGRAQRDARKVDENARKIAAINAKHEREEQQKREAAERLAKTTVAPIENKVDRVKQAQIEAKAVKAWEASGRKGKRPDSVNYDAILVGVPVVSSAKRSSSKSSTPRVEQTVIFYTGVSDFEGSRHNRLSAIAARNKMPVTELRKLLAAAKITEPTTQRWQLTLPNGVVVGARMPGDPAPSKQTSDEPAARPAAKTTKQTTKSTPASKRVVDGISGKPAAKSLARKSVTPLPKTSAAKRTTRKGA